MYDGFPLYVQEDLPVTPMRFALAKVKAVTLFRKKVARYRQVFRMYATRKYKCKPSAVDFKPLSLMERSIRQARLCPLEPLVYGEADGWDIRVNSEMSMGFDALVGTLLHEALHCFCRVRGRWLPISGEHHCMQVLGEPKFLTSCH